MPAGPVASCVDHMLCAAMLTSILHDWLQDMLEDCASWLLEHGSHVTSLCLSSHQPVSREEGKHISWRESQLYVTATACLGACASSLQHLKLRWHQNLDLGHHFLLLRALTSLHVESDVAVHPSMLVGHTGLRWVLKCG